MNSNKPANIDEYIAHYPKPVQQLLQDIRKVIADTAPGAEEAIKYGIPAFIYNGDLVYFAAFKNHIGFYPAPTGIESFSKELSIYKTGRGSVQFPLDQPMPFRLIKDIVKFRLIQNKEKIKKKKAPK